MIRRKSDGAGVTHQRSFITIQPGNPYEIRDRGLIYAQLDCEHVALND
ncbi:hypothetical protein ACNKHM_29290 [Shigella sonnei]